MLCCWIGMKFLLTPTINFVHCQFLWDTSINIFITFLVSSLMFITHLTNTFLSLSKLVVTKTVYEINCLNVLQFKSIPHPTGEGSSYAVTPGGAYQASISRPVPVTPPPPVYTHVATPRPPPAKKPKDADVLMCDTCNLSGASSNIVRYIQLKFEYWICFYFIFDQNVRFDTQLSTSAKILDGTSIFPRIR